MIASSGDLAKHPTAFYLWLGLSAMSACVGGHVAYAADLNDSQRWDQPGAGTVPWLLGTGTEREPGC